MRTSAMGGKQFLLFAEQVLVELSHLLFGLLAFRDVFLHRHIMRDDTLRILDGTYDGCGPVELAVLLPVIELPPLHSRPAEMESHNRTYSSLDV